MTFNFVQLQTISQAIDELKETKLPFKLSLILAKDSALVKKEIEFFIEQEREFATKYLEQDDQGNFVQTSENVFKILEGKEEECREARAALDAFTTELELRKIPIDLIENLEFTPAQLEALEPILDEGEEEE